MKEEYYTDEEDWYNDEPYKCPHCGSHDVERTAYGDGRGYIDVEMECNDCGGYDWVE